MPSNSKPAANSAANAPASNLIAHWPLAGHARDIANDTAPNNTAAHHGAARNITYTTGPTGKPNTAALFNGRDSVITVPDAPELQLAGDPFTLTAWVRSTLPMVGAPGDILSKFDPERRCGINLWISGGSTCYSSFSDARHVHAGIDDAYLAPWQSAGNPGQGNPLVSTLTAYQGNLYAGLSDAATPEESAKVFRWDGNQSWTDCGRLGTDLNYPSVMSMIVHDGKLYAGTGAWDWGRADAARLADTPRVLTRVFRYEGGTTWTDLGQVGASQRVITMASFNGNLYVGLDRGDGGHCYKLENDQWVDCGVLDDEDNFECLMPVAGALYGASHHAFYRYEGGKSWTCIGRNPHDITQIHAFQVAQGKLWAGTWPQGYILRHEDDFNWTNTGKVGIDVGKPGVAPINEINAVGMHNGKLYAGTIPKAQVYRYEADGQWSIIDSLASTPNWDPQDCPSWMRILSLSTFQGQLFTCTGTCMARHQDIDPDQTAGRVLHTSAGLATSHDHDIQGDWTHIAFVRKPKEIRLYINGRLAQRTKSPKGRYFDLGNAQPLTIGSGQQSSFAGAISDLKLHRGPLDDPTIQALATPN